MLFFRLSQEAATSVDLLKFVIFLLKSINLSLKYWFYSRHSAKERLRGQKKGIRHAIRLEIIAPCARVPPQVQETSAYPCHHGPWHPQGPRPQGILPPERTATVQSSRCWCTFLANTRSHFLRGGLAPVSSGRSAINSSLSCTNLLDDVRTRPTATDPTIYPLASQTAARTTAARPPPTPATPSSRPTPAAPHRRPQSGRRAVGQAGGGVKGDRAGGRRKSGGRLVGVGRGVRLAWGRAKGRAG